MITDCHIHIQPLNEFKPEALALMKKSRKDFAQIEEYCRSPKAFLGYLDRVGIDRAVLINYVAPEVIGFTPAVNEFIANYVKADPKRLLPCGSVHPRHTRNVLADMEQIVRLGIRLIKIHPPHQLLYPNDYVNGVKELEIIYRAAEANGIPIMVHTGTSIFPGARNKYGDPMYVDDVAVDFPRLEDPAGAWRPPALDGHCVLPGAPASQRLPRHQRHPAQVAADLLPPPGRDRAQDAVRHGLAGPGRAGRGEEPEGVSALPLSPATQRADSQQDCTGNLARVGNLAFGTVCRASVPRRALPAEPARCE